MPPEPLQTRGTTLPPPHAPPPPPPRTLAYLTVPGVSDGVEYKWDRRGGAGGDPDAIVPRGAG